ncbi:hypothetical protein BDV97DRAFT_361633 [Delphinella strobiligena]|nr:hypothetical protein BDV97DRAFT_361633 [Delphinella strobiligena]
MQCRPCYLCLLGQLGQGHILRHICSSLTKTSPVLSLRWIYLHSPQGVSLPNISRARQIISAVFPLPNEDCTSFSVGGDAAMIPSSSASSHRELDNDLAGVAQSVERVALIKRQPQGRGFEPRLRLFLYYKCLRILFGCCRGLIFPNRTRETYSVCAYKLGFLIACKMPRPRLIHGVQDFHRVETVHVPYRCISMPLTAVDGRQGSFDTVMAAGCVGANVRILGRNQKVAVQALIRCCSWK